MALGLSTVVQSFSNSYVGSQNPSNQAVNQFYLGQAAAVSALVLTNLPPRAIVQYGNFTAAATPFVKAFPALVGCSPRLVARTTVSRLGNLNWPYGG